MEKPKELLRNIFEELTSLFEELYENQLYILYNFQWRISRPNFWSFRNIGGGRMEAGHS
jgi:hypothetical protein